MNGMVLIVTWLVAAPSFAVLQDDPLEVVTHWPGGEVHLRYTVDEEGAIHGSLEEFREDGSLLREEEYRHGLRWGRSESFHPGGERWVVAQYQNDLKDGAYREYAEDGRKVEISQWRQGQRHGRFESFHADGSRHIVANYREGELHGAFKELLEDGAWERSASYERGVLHGAVKIVRDRKTLSKQTWVDGELSVLDGLRPFPVGRDELRAQLAATLGEAQDVDDGEESGEGEGGSAGGQSDPDEAEDDPLMPQRQQALRLLQAYRQLCRLPFEDMVLEPGWKEFVDAAAEVCRANGRLSHDPPRPAGMDEETYRKGHRGAKSSNLSQGSGIVGSVDSYMDDSDPSNIDRVGHRRWCLNPHMRRTAFGGAGRFSAMWSFDSSGPGARGLDAVQYPPEGFTPVDFFAPHHAWSVATLRGGVMKETSTKIEIVELDEHYLPLGEPLPINYLKVAGGGYGTGPCLIFRPDQLQVIPGARYRCRISFDGGRRWTYDYLVEFVEPLRNGHGRRRNP